MLERLNLIYRKLFSDGDPKGAIALAMIPKAHKGHLNHKQYCRKLIRQCKKALEE